MAAAKKRRPRKRPLTDEQRELIRAYALVYLRRTIAALADPFILLEPRQ